MSNGCSATGQICYDRETLEASSGLDSNGDLSIHEYGTGCSTLENAKRKVVKKLANQLRSRIDEGIDFIYWPNLSSNERDKWWSEVCNRLVWITVSDKHSRLGNISASAFVTVLNGEVV